jgi:predicted ATPase
MDKSLVGQQLFLRPAGVSEWPDHTVSARYAFLHAVYQTVWHEQVSPARLQEWHRRIGERKEVAYGERVGEIAAALAVHFEQGRQYDKEVQYLQQAAGIALRRSANPEAIHYLQQALATLQALPDTPERVRQELSLQVTLGTPLMMMKGYAAPEVERVYARARALCQQVKEPSHLFPVLYALWRFYVLRADFRTAYEQSEQFLRLAQSIQDSGCLFMAHMTQEVTLVFRGEFAPAHAHLKQGMTFYDPQQHRAFISLYGDDPKVTCLSHGAWALWYLGYPDQALKSMHEALILAQDLSYPFILALALSCTAQLHVYRREGQAAQERAEALIALANEHRFPHFLAYGSILRGGALAEQGRGEEGIMQIRQGLTTCQAIGQELGGSYFLALLAEACSVAGQVKEGLLVLAEALEAAHKTGECLHEAELYRLKGELTLQAANQKAKGKRQKSKITDPRPLIPDPQGEAEACFLKAIDIARKQQAKSLELRAAMSLTRLRQRQAQDHATRNTLNGSRALLAEAHTMLSEIYNWFTEGFDTRDLQEAKALIEELSH